MSAGPGPSGRITLRADSGFYSHNMVATLNDLGVDYSITVPLYSNVRAAIGAIAEKAWILYQVSPRRRSPSRGDHHLGNASHQA